MAIEIDKGTTALLVMDVQNDIIHPDAPLAQQMGFAQAVEAAGLIPRLQGLLAGARRVGLPVVHVLLDPEGGKQPRMPHRGMFFQMISGAKFCQRGTWGGEVHEALKPAPGEDVVYKWIFSAFASSDLADVLERRGITDLILTGVSTDFVVESTGWDAVDHGYSVILAEDGCVCATEEKHRQTVERMAPRCDVASCADILAAIGAA